MEIMVQLTIVLYIFGKVWAKGRLYETVGFERLICAVTCTAAGLSVIILVVKTMMMMKLF